MEFLRTRRLPGWFFLLAIVFLGGAVYQGMEVYRLHGRNRALADPDQAAVDENTAPIVLFAKARRLDQTGKTGEAMRLYASLCHTGDPDLRARAFHNLGTIYLREAARQWNQRGVLEYAHVNTQVELAKENYREALRLNPDNWDARFNLEYAFRITPPPKEKPKSDFQGSKSSVYSTLPGLPAGGP